MTGNEIDGTILKNKLQEVIDRVGGYKYEDTDDSKLAQQYDNGVVDACNWLLNLIERV